MLTTQRDPQVFANLFARLTPGRDLRQFNDRHLQLPLPRDLRSEIERTITHIRWANPAAYQTFLGGAGYSRLQTELEFY